MKVIKKIYKAFGLIVIKYVQYIVVKIWYIVVDLRYFPKGREGIPQSLGFNLWTQISNEYVVMFWKRRDKKQKLVLSLTKQIFS